jgi:hypothetical protein
MTMTITPGEQAIRDSLPISKGWRYAHDGAVVDVTVHYGHCWPEIAVIIQQRGTGVRASGQFAADGHLRIFTFEATDDAVEVTPAMLRRLPAVRALQQWQTIGREVARQILDSIPEQEIRIDGLSATEALRILTAAARNTPEPRRRRGSSREELIREVAQAYREAVAGGDPAPRATLADRFGYSRAHIGRLLVAARRTRSGQPPLLGPAQRGKAGETAMLQTDP